MSSKIASLSFFNQPWFRVWLKACAILVAISFILPYLGWAFDAMNYAPAKHNYLRTAHLGKVLAIPEKMGTINRGFQGDKKTIVCIQDLHCNYEVQKNIAGIIHHLAGKHGLKLVGEEGAFDTVNTDKIRTFPIKQIREQVSDYFVKQGKLTGAEYYAAAGGQPVRLEGIETPALYEASQEAVRGFLNYESQGYCCDLRGMLDELKESIYNPRLQKFDEQRMKYREGDLGILKYCAYLHAAACRFKLDLSIYPNLSQYLSLNQNFFSSKVDPDQLFHELDQLDQDIRGHLYTSDIQQELDEIYARLDIIEKLLNISASPEELQKFRNQRNQFSTREFIRFISRGDSRIALSGLLDPEITMLDHYLDKVEDFYRLADERSIQFAANLVQKMDRYEESLAVMINGGFHTDKVLAELKRRNITYVSIKPRLTRHDVVNPYFDLLRNRETPLEKLLAKNQTIMAIWTALDNKKFLANLELIFKPWAQALALNAKELEQLKIYLAENTLIEVAMISESQASEAGLKNVAGVKIFSTTLISDTGEPIVVLLAPEGEIPKQLVQKPIDSKTINGTRFNIYSSIKAAAKVTQAIQKSQSPISAMLGRMIKRVAGILARIQSIERKADVTSTLTLPVTYKLFWFLPKRVVDIVIAPILELIFTLPISLTALLGLKMANFEKISDDLTRKYLGVHISGEKIKEKYRKTRKVGKAQIIEVASTGTDNYFRSQGIHWINLGAKYGIIAGVIVGIGLAIISFFFGTPLPLLGQVSDSGSIAGVILKMTVPGLVLGNILPHSIYNLLYPKTPLNLLDRFKKKKEPAAKVPKNEENESVIRFGGDENIYDPRNPWSSVHIPRELIAAPVQAIEEIEGRSSIEEYDWVFKAYFDAAEKGEEYFIHTMLFLRAFLKAQKAGEDIKKIYSDVRKIENKISAGKISEMWKKEKGYFISPQENQGITEKGIESGLGLARDYLRANERDFPLEDYRNEIIDIYGLLWNFLGTPDNKRQAFLQENSNWENLIKYKPGDFLAYEIWIEIIKMFIEANPEYHSQDNDVLGSRLWSLVIREYLNQGDKAVRERSMLRIINTCDEAMIKSLLAGINTLMLENPAFCEGALQTLNEIVIALTVSQAPDAEEKRILVANSIKVDEIQKIIDKKDGGNREERYAKLAGNIVRLVKEWIVDEQQDNKVTPEAAEPGTLNFFQKKHEQLRKQLEGAKWFEKKFSEKYQFFLQNLRLVISYYLTHPITAGFTETIGIFGVLHGIGPLPGLLAMDPTGLGFLTICAAALVGAAFAIFHPDVWEAGISKQGAIRFTKRFVPAGFMIAMLIILPLLITPVAALALTIVFHVGWNLKTSIARTETDHKSQSPISAAEEISAEEEFVRRLKEKLGDRKRKKILIIGSGGIGQAMAEAAANVKEYIENIVLRETTHAEAQKRAADVAKGLKQQGISAEVMGNEELNQIIDEFDIVAEAAHPDVSEELIKSVIENEKVGIFLSVIGLVKQLEVLEKAGESDTLIIIPNAAFPKDVYRIEKEFDEVLEAKICSTKVGKEEYKFTGNALETLAKPELAQKVNVVATLILALRPKKCPPEKIKVEYSQGPDREFNEHNIFIKGLKNGEEKELKFSVKSVPSKKAATSGSALLSAGDAMKVVLETKKPWHALKICPNVYILCYQGEQKLDDSTKKALDKIAKQPRDKEAVQKAKKPEYNVPLGKRNLALDLFPFILLRRGAIIFMSGLFMLAAPALAITQRPLLNNLSAEETDRHGQMLKFKRSHGMTNIASVMKDNPENITLQQVSIGKFLWHTVLSPGQRSNEFYLTEGMLRSLNLDTINEDTKGLGQWFTRSFWAKQLLTYSLEHQTKLYENTIKWPVRLAKWGLYPLGSVLLYKEEEAATIDSERKTYAEYYVGKTFRDLTPTDIGRLFNELIEDINATLPENKQINIELTKEDALKERLQSEEFLALKDGNEKLLEVLESIDGTLWQKLLKEFRGQAGEALVSAGIIEDVMKTQLTETKEDIDVPERAMRDVGIQTNVTTINAVTAPETAAYMLSVLGNDDIKSLLSTNLARRLTILKLVLNFLMNVEPEAGVAVSLEILNPIVSQNLAGELDRLHARDEALAAKMGEENGDKIYSICDARQKKIPLKTADGKGEHAFLAPTTGESIGKDVSEETIISEIKKGTLHFFEFQGRPRPLSRESEPNIISVIVSSVLILLIEVLTVRGRNIICPGIQKLFPSFTTAYLDHAIKRAIKDLIKKDGFKKAGIEIDKLALTGELTRPNSYLRQQYRRMAQEPGNLRLQAEFAKSIVRFMIKYDEKQNKDAVEGWTAIDRNQMHIMLAGRLAEYLNTMPMIENYAKPDTGYKKLKKQTNDKETNELGNFSIFAILFPEELPEKYKNVLGVRGTAGALTDFLETNHFIVHKETREKYFRRTFELRTGSAV